ncbi:hypothetical protein DM860_002702 [Cuscuta australis]|uniref:Protein kinase domain-containing protein n=1 Tax=Cuscuta australis TaxID=267555 RepID=A0A328CZQ4_9ASTE|nr:hypothetical protein DM860_002702 [Cuscuta australis]
MTGNPIFQRVLFLSVLYLSALQGDSSLATAAYHPPSPPVVAKPNCSDKCGDVTIPFPFGIGPARCFLDSTFEILCNNGTVPVLSRSGLEVLDIALPGYSPAGEPNPFSEYRWTPTGTIRVKRPTSYTTCPGKGNNTLRAWNLFGDNFYYSTENLFVSVGCNNLAVIRGGDPTVVGCDSTCIGNGTSRYSYCLGTDCCRTLIPSGIPASNGIRFLDQTVAPSDAAQDKCKFAFIVDRKWFGTGQKDLNTLRDTDSFPVVIDWDVNRGSLTQVGPSSACDIYSPSLNQSLTCYCRMGYTGNALLKNCKDINECEDSRACGSKKCVNTLGGYRCEERGKVAKVVGIGIGIGVGAILLFLLALWVWRVMRRRKETKRKRNFFKRNGGLLLKREVSSSEGNYVDRTRIYSSVELEKATHNFNKNRVLGQGGQGTVYKGMLEDGRIVAIKKSIAMDSDRVDTFINEVVILSQINHRNVVKLLGCCLETEVPLLVYEFIPKATLHYYIHNPIADEFSLTWDMRLKIALEIAGALYYLHSVASMPIYHRDIKSTNIMLYEKYQAKVADFGTSKSVSIDRTHVTTKVQGTFGYLDPEYFQSSQFTNKSDVYSFGVVLAELLTGKRPITMLECEEHRSLATYFVLAMERGQLFEILDRQVREQGSEEQIAGLAELTRRCLSLSGRSRPTMREAVSALENILRMSSGCDRLNREELLGVVETERTKSLVQSWDEYSTELFASIEEDNISSSDIPLTTRNQN